MNVTPSAMGLTIDLDSQRDTETLGRALAEVCESGCVIGLIGPLGQAKPGSYVQWRSLWESTRTPLPVQRSS